MRKFSTTLRRVSGLAAWATLGMSCTAFAAHTDAAIRGFPGASPTASALSEEDPVGDLNLGLRRSSNLERETQHSRPLKHSFTSDVLASNTLSSHEVSRGGRPEAGGVVTPRVWEISPADRTLKNTLARWAAADGWQLVWELQVDYPVETRATIEGSLDEAVGIVARTLDDSGVPIQAIFYAGNRVLRVIAKGSK